MSGTADALRAILSTYRLQFRPGFGFEEARAIVPYLADLGVTHVYASPLLKPRPGSEHGYDTADPTTLNPELGTREAFESLVRDLHARGMGLLLDIVPNHMAAHHANPFWWDMLEHGTDSAHASLFDIDWEAGGGRVTLPVLGGTPDDAIAKGELRITPGEHGLEFTYHDRRLPIAPSTYDTILRRLREEAAGDEELVRGLDHLVGLNAERAAAAAGMDRHAASLAARRFAEAIRTNGRVNDSLDQLNNAGSEPAHMQWMRSLLERQHYRLEFWRDGLARVNYRRFFDVSDLVCVRSDTEQGFAAMHGLMLELLRAGLIDGLRIDHVDGLRDPLTYLRMLRRHADEHAGRPIPIVVEKILAEDETLPEAWPVDGTTGYEFVNALSRVLVDHAGFHRLASHARRSLGLSDSFADTLFEAKRAALETLFPAELDRLTDRLAALAAARGPEVGTPAEIRAALLDLTSTLAVYRTYIREPGETDEQDRNRLNAAAEAVRARATWTPAHAFALSVLTLDPSLPGDETTRTDATEFVLRWQQLSGPAMAKGLEDTALYRHVVLSSLNEVGGRPEIESDALPAFHAHNRLIAEHSGRSLHPLSTHDTKRSEDARARIAVLSEIPDEWTAALDRWIAAHAHLRADVDAKPAPTPLDESLIYQSLLGIWPLDLDAENSIAERLAAYAVKAAREAKRRTSWLSPNEAYESALKNFIERLLNKRENAAFLESMRTLAERVAFHGALNSLTQTLLRLAAPGTPDTYQGTELVDLSLVDPDNRRPVDFDRCVALLREVDSFTRSTDAPSPRTLLERWREGLPKLHVTRNALLLRRRLPHLFLGGSYIPLEPTGPRARHVCAFARREGDTWCIAIGTRFTASLCEPPDMPLGAVWESTTLSLPADAPQAWDDALRPSGRVATVSGGIRLADACRDYPVALLVAGTR